MAKVSLSSGRGSGRGVAVGEAKLVGALSLAGVVIAHPHRAAAVARADHQVIALLLEGHLALPQIGEHQRVAALEIGDHVVAEAAAEHVAVVAGSTAQLVAAAAADQLVVAGAAVQRVAAGAADQAVVEPVADDDIAAAAADRVLDLGAEGDREVVGEAADAAERAGHQADPLRHAIAGQVQRVVAGAIPDRDDRAPVEREVERGAHVVGSVEAVSRVAGAGLVIGAVDALDGENVHQHRRGGLDSAVGRRLVHVVRHQGVLAAVEVVGRIVLHRAAVIDVVVVGMGEPDRVADLVDQGHPAEPALTEVATGIVVGVDPDVAAQAAVRVVGMGVDDLGRGVAEADVGVAGDFLELDVGDVGP